MVRSRDTASRSVGFDAFVARARGWRGVGGALVVALSASATAWSGSTQADGPAPKPPAIPSEVVSGSNAHNYASGMTETVNPRTGQLTLIHTFAVIPGVVKEMDLRLTLEYTGATGPSAYGAPQGWIVGLSYLEKIDGGDGWELHLQERGRYQVDSTWSSKAPDGTLYYSGLRYYNLRDLTFQALKNEATTPCTFSGTAPSYVFVTNYFDGKADYFDKGGRLVCQKDRFGNQLTYVYTSDVPADEVTAFNSRLTTITDTWNNTTSFDWIGGLITLPDARQITLGFTLGSLTSISDPYTGEGASCASTSACAGPTEACINGHCLTATQLVLDTANRPTEIQHSTGALTEITYQDQGLPYDLEVE